LSDQFANAHANIKIAHRFEQGVFEFTPYFNLRFTSSGFNDRYYALVWLGNEGFDGGTDYQAGADVKYHVVSNLYLFGALSFRWLDSSVRDAAAVTKNWETEAFVGIGLFNEKRQIKRKDIGLKPYLRIAHGWATSSSLGDVLIGDIDSRDNHNQMTSLFYGYPLTDRLFGLPIDCYITSGFAYHYSSKDQNSAQEYVVAIKAYYTIKLPVRLRFGASEGFSYISEVTSLERKNTAAEGYEPSNLLNYLDLSLDLNVGDILQSDSFENLWIGAALHHRSAIFESAQQFSGIAGGSNYPSLYLQYHF
jgi:outer membrane protein